MRSCARRARTWSALAGGCVCCRVAGDLVRALRELHFQRAAGDGAGVPRASVIETTGLADPAPLLAHADRDAARRGALLARGRGRRRSTPSTAWRTLDEHPEAVKQAAIADRLVITKCDRVRRRAIDALEARLRGAQPGRARAARGATATPIPAELFDTGLYRGEGSARGRARAGSNAGAYRRAGASTPAPATTRASASFVWTREEPLAWERPRRRPSTSLLELRGERILRAEGAGERRRRARRRARSTRCSTRVYPPARLPAWPDADRRTRLVFIVARP